MESSSSRQLHIHLVDDSPSDNFLHLRLLNRHFPDLRANAALSGPEALQYLQACVEDGTAPIDLILLDINMPDMDAWGFLAEYARLPETCRARWIVLMAGENLPADMLREVETNPFINACMPKPIQPAALAEIINYTPLPGTDQAK